MVEGVRRRKGWCCSLLSGDVRHHAEQHFFVICHCFLILKNVIKEIADMVRVRCWVTASLFCHGCAVLRWQWCSCKKKKKRRKEASCLMSPGLNTEKTAMPLREIHAKHMIYSKTCHCIYLFLAFSLCGSLRLEFSPLMQHWCFARGLKRSLPSAAGVVNSLHQCLLALGPGGSCQHLPKEICTAGTCQWELLLFATTLLFTAVFLPSLFYYFFPSPL